MTKNAKTILEEIAQEIVKSAGLKVQLGEYDFANKAAKLIEPVVSKWYVDAGLEPLGTERVAKWFYHKPPSWAIALLVNEKEKFIQQASPRLK